MIACLVGDRERRPGRVICQFRPTDRMKQQQQQPQQQQQRQLDDDGKKEREREQLRPRRLQLAPRTATLTN
jgi:hypothetical protein